MVKPQAKSASEMMTAQEAELQQELAVVKEQLEASESGKAEAMRECANVKSLLNDLLLVEHFAAADDVAVPLPPNWSDGLSGQLHAGKEIDRLRNEVQASAAELERAKQEIAGLKADLGSAQDLTSELKDEIHKLRRLQPETELSEEMISRHEASVIIVQSNNNALQADLKTLQPLHETTATELQNSKQAITALHAGDYKTTLSNAKEEIHRLQPGRESTEEDNKELQTTKLEVIIGQYFSTCTELTGKIEKFGGECEALQVKYDSFFHLANREENLKLQAEVAALTDENMMKITALDALRTELKKSEATVAVLQAEIGNLKAQLRDSVHECLVSTRSQLQKVRIELAIVKEVLGCVSGDLSAELEAIRLQLPYCLTSLPHFVGSWMKQFERDCWIKAAVEKMKALEVELKSLCWKQAAQICQVNSKEPESSESSDEEVLETYFAELQVNALDKKWYVRPTRCIA